MQKNKDENKKPARTPAGELAPYIAILVFSIVILKFVIGYFGREYLLDPTDENTIAFGIALFVCFATPMGFAIWKHNNDSEEES